MERDLGLILLAVIGSAGAFAACSSPEDPVSGPAGGSHGCGRQCAGSVGCAATTTTCSTTGCSGTTPTSTTSDSTPLTTTLSCMPQIAGGACAAGATISCFDGPPASLAAPCAAGTATCVADASGYDAACVGEILPHPDACDFASAWSCDASPPGCGPGLFAEAFAGGGNESATSVGLDAAGNVVVAGNATATDLQFGPIDVKLTGIGGFVAKLDASRQPLWAVGLQGASTTKVAVEPSGAIYAAGTFDHALRVGTNVLQGSGHRSSFVAKLSPGGTVVWLSRLDESGSAVVDAIAVAPSGNLLLAGSYSGKSTQVGGVMLPVSSDTSGFVTMLDPLDGSAQWVTGLRVSGDLTLRAIAADAGDEISVAGAMLTPSACDERPLIGQLDPLGGIAWLRELTFPGIALAVAVDDQGAVVTGSVRGALDISGVTTRADGFIARLAQSGQPQWTRALPDWEGHAIGVDDAGAIVAAGVSLASAGNPARGHAQKSDDEGFRFYDLAFTPTPLQGGNAASLSVDALTLAPGLGAVLAGGLRGSATFGAGATPPSAASTTRLDPWIAALGP